MKDRLLSIAIIVVLVLLIVLLLTGKRDDSIKADDVRPFPTNFEGVIELDGMLMENAEGRGRSAPQRLDMKGLAAHLDSAGSDVERARAAYVWVCENIEYDLEALENEVYVENPKDVFRDRKAICGGIANLYTELLEQMGMQAVTVIGHLKGYGYSPGSDLTDDQLHAWNAVKLDRGWILVDCTLGSGFQDALSGYVRAYDPYYFAPPPEEFISTHLPKKVMWQMLDQSLSEEQFKNSPILKRAFFKNGLEFLSNPQAVYEVDSMFIFDIGNAPKKRTVVRVSKDGVTLDKDLSFSQRKGNLLRIYADFPEPGEYAVELYVNQGSEDLYDLAMVVGVVSKDKDNPKRFPEKMAGFSEMDINVGFPLTAILETGSTVDFMIEAPTAEKVAVSQGSDFDFLTDYGPYWGGTVQIKSSPTVEIMVEKQYGTEDLYNAVLRYRTK